MPLWSNIAELVDYYIPPPPSIYWIDIVRDCNLRCIMCPQSRGLKPWPAKMPLTLLQRIVDDVCGDHPLIKLYVSGEPLLHENLFEMIEYVGARGCRSMIHTNAVALTREVAEKILSSSLTFLSFSFDGCSPQIYEHLRPPARFEEVRSNIRQYLALRRERVNGGPRTTIEIIRMKETEPLLDRFTEEWTASGIDEVRIAEYTTWHGLVEDRSVGPGRMGERYKACAAPFRHGCILSDGIAVPCCLDVNGRMPLGNVAASPFAEIWAGNDYRRLRLQMLTGGLPPDCICNGCQNMFSEA